MPGSGFVAWGLGHIKALFGTREKTKDDFFFFFFLIFSKFIVELGQILVFRLFLENFLVNSMCVKLFS